MVCLFNLLVLYFKIVNWVINLLEIVKIWNCYLIYNFICVIYMNLVIYLKIKKSWYLLLKELKKSFIYNDKIINIVNCIAYYKLFYLK